MMQKAPEVEHEESPMVSPQERPREDEEEEDVREDESCDDSDFEFAIISDDPEFTTADEIFVNGMIRPVYPVFGRDMFLFGPDDHWSRSEEEVKREEVEKVVSMSLRKLMLEDERDRMMMSPSFSSSKSEALEGLPVESYCAWSPGSVTKKSKSTGSSSSPSWSSRWRLRDLVVGRSQSDGEKKFVFLTQRSWTSKKKSAVETGLGEERKKEKKAKKKTNREAAHRLYYVKGGESPPAADHRRSLYVPYRKDLVGIFTDVNGTSRGLHPF